MLINYGVINIINVEFILGRIDYIVNGEYNVNNLFVLLKIRDSFYCLVGDRIIIYFFFILRIVFVVWWRIE